MHVQEDLRQKSSALVNDEIIDAVDTQLIQFVQDNRETSNVLIDSHPVTKEQYGYRVTAFSLARIVQLRPTQIWVVYADPDVTISRIAREPNGRPLITLEEARMHTHMQASVAITYGMTLGVPVHFFQSHCDLDSLANKLSRRLQTKL
jgi:adenylate kinase